MPFKFSQSVYTVLPVVAAPLTYRPRPSEPIQSQYSPPALAALKETYWNSQGASQFLLQSIRIRLRYTNLVWIIHPSNGHQPKHGGYKSPHQHSTPAWFEMRVLFGREDAEDIVVFVNGFAVVASLLLVPPIAVGVA